MTRSRIWTLGTVGVVLAVLVGGWFLLVSPTRAKAADIEQQTTSQEATNAQLTSRIEQLKVQAQDLPAQEAKIAEFRQRIPTGPQLPSFIRQLSDIAQKSNVVLVSMEPSNPAPLTIQVQGSTTVSPQTGAEDDATVTLSGAATTTTSLQYVAAKVTIQGGYFNTEQFLSKLEKLQRSFLVTGFDITPTTDSSGTGATGDVTTNLQVRVFFAGSLSAPIAGSVTTSPTTAN